MICAEYVPGIFAEIDELLRALATPPRQQQVYDRIMRRVEQYALSTELFMPVDVPASICAVHALDRRVLCKSAAACTLLWAGADLMDDASDGDATEDWGVSDHQLALMYTNLLATLPQLIVSDFGGEGALPGAAAFGVAIADTLWRMSNGQFDDLESHAVVQTSADYFAVIGGKTGAEIALFASAPAMLAGLPDATIAAWREFGMQFGCMVQLFSDIQSTFVEATRNDLTRGKRTLPVTHTLESLGPAERAMFERDLELVAAGAADAGARAVERMHDSSAVFYSLSRVELLRYRAAAALPIALDELDREHPFRRLLTSLSVV